MKQVALLGAGGNMGRRITKSLLADGDHVVRHIEPAARGQVLLRDLGVDTVDRDAGLAGAETVIFAVPDAIVRDVAAEVVPILDPGTSMLFLDPAAIAADRIPRRSDIHCYVTHPTHPPLYSLLAEPSAAARTDYWGGGLAHQALVFAVAWGDTHGTADDVERLATTMFAPISRSHRITVAQMAMLEPALSETLTNGCIALIREGLQRVIADGVPPDAARDFLMGHLQIGISIIFEQLDWKLSEGAAMALDEAKHVLFKDDWDSIFTPDAILTSVRQITGGD